jgi:putative spermidine/putrescine transport system permease protein
MAAEPTSAVPSIAALSPQLRQRERRTRLTGLVLMSPAVLLVALFLFLPLVFILRMSVTEGNSFLSPGGPVFTLQNYVAMAGRYVPNLLITIELAALAMVVDLIFGVPFAYILVRKVRYRDLVRAFMVFPMFGALYIAFGLGFLFLPGGPAAPLLGLLGVSSTQALYGLPSTVFAMAIFTFPFMVMNVGAALSNVDPNLEEAAACLGARPWQTFVRILIPLTRSGIVAGMLMVFGWNLGAFAEPLLLGGLNEQRTLALTIYNRGVVQSDYGTASAMSVVLLVLAVVVSYVSLRYSRDALV